MSAPIAQTATEQVSGKLNLRDSLDFVMSLLIVLALSIAVWWLTKIFPTLFTGNLNRILKTPRRMILYVGGLF